MTKGIHWIMKIDRGSATIGNTTVRQSTCPFDVFWSIGSIENQEKIWRTRSQCEQSFLMINKRLSAFFQMFPLIESLEVEVTNASWLFGYVAVIWHSILFKYIRCVRMFGCTTGKGSMRFIIRYHIQMRSLAFIEVILYSDYPY